MELFTHVDRTTGTVQTMKKTFCILLGLLSFAVVGVAQSGEAAMQKEADALFENEEFAQAMPLYSQLVSLHPSNFNLNYKLGTCIIYSDENKETAIGFLKYSVEDPSTPSEAWFYLGKCQQLTYRFKEALGSYDKFKSNADKKALAKHEVQLAVDQCQNGLKLLSNIKDVRVLNKLEVDVDDFFRFYDLDDIGGKIVVTPDELKSSVDKKRGLQSLVYLPTKGGAIYFSSYGKDAASGKDIYRSELRPDGKFMPPVRLPATINTSADEDYAFMHPDGKTFYFSSKGHSSMGGYDVFKTLYDPSRDFYGQPENMDFAVNTPDDDILYLVDPTGKEACFASARQSAQGSIHVYRVQTDQVPLTLTILKGTYRSEIDPVETDARIVVEDAISHEIIGEYNTETDGSYIISFPRSGKYKFIVTPSSSGKTHMGLVELPRSENSNAYAQELTLVMQGTQEKLIIKNFFDEALDEDLLSLAQEEIRRRALLDVNGPVDETEGPIVQADPLREAGFGPDVTMEDAMAMASLEADKLTQGIEELGTIKEQAYGIAEEQTKAAQKFKDEAAVLAEDADLGNGDLDEALMAEAALLQVRSQRANQRAYAAERLGVDLDAEHEDRSEEASELGNLELDLNKASSENRPDEMVAMLSALKNKVDGRTADAEVSIDLQERIRRNATDLQHKAAAHLDRMLESSAEENRLTTRIARLKREQENLKGKKKAANEEELARYEGDLAGVQDDTKNYLAKAEKSEKEAVAARQQVELLDLLTSGRSIEVPVLSSTRKKQLPDEIAQVDREIAELPIEERFKEEAEIQFSDVADTESSVTAILPDSFEVPDATMTELSTTATIESEELAHVDTELMELEEAEAAVTEVLDGNTNVQESTEVLDRSEDTIKANEETAVLPNESIATGEDLGDVSENVSAATDDPLAEETSVMSAEDFEVDNELAELIQTRDALDDEDEIARINEEIARIEEERNSESASTGIMEGYDPNMSDDELEQVLGLYVFDKEEAIPSSEEKFKIEKRKIQVLDQKIAQQQAEIQNDPVDIIQRQALVDRLRGVKAMHEAAAFNYQQEVRDPVVELQPYDDLASEVDGETIQTNDLLSADQDVRITSAIERYIAIDRESTRVFESNTAFKSGELNESKALFDADVAEMNELNTEIDSLRLTQQDMLAGKEYDRVTKKIDKRIDDMLIQRTELGMRSEFLTKKERQYLVDSLTTVSKETASEEGQETTLAMVEEFESSSEASFDNAKRIRKKAERSMDTVEKDQLYRQAYNEELSGLQDVGRAITVHKFAQSEYFVPGTNNTIRQMEDALFGPVQTVVEEEVFVDAGSETTEIADEFADVGSSDTEDATSSELPTGEVTETASPAEASAAVSVSTSTSTVAQIEADRVAEAEGIDARITDQRVLEEIALFESVAYSKLEEAERMYAEADILYARAEAMEDSASTLKKKKARALLADAEQLRKHADISMQLGADLNKESNLAKLSANGLRERQVTSWNFYRYYSLTPDDLLLLEEDEDVYKYFQARSNVLALLEEASEKDLEAEANHTLAEMYLNEAKDILVGQHASNENPDPQTMQRAKELNDQAAILLGQADSLQSLAGRLRSKAGLSSQIADGLLIDVGAQKANMILELEDRVGRSKPADGQLALAEEQDVDLPVIAPGTTFDDPADAVAAREAISDVEVTANDEELLTQTVSEEGTLDPEEDTSTATVEEEVSEPAEELLDVAEEATAELETIDEDPLQNAIAVMPGQADAVAVEETPEPVAEEELVVATVTSTNTAGMLMADVFYISDEPRANRTIPMNEAMPRGVVYKVQVGAFSDRIPNDLYGDLDPVTGEQIGNGLVRYSAGLFVTYDGAADAKKLVRDRGYSDAFVVAYIDGKRVSLTQAEEQMSIDRPELIAAPVIANTSTTAPVAVEASVPETADPVTVELPEYDMATLNTDYGNDPNAAPADKVETIKGLFYTVQVGVYSKPVALDKLYNISPLNTELIRNSMIRYTTGRYSDVAGASARKDETRTAGVTDAFVTAYMNGKRIPLGEAKALLEQHGSSILAE